ncbi:MAG: hypothetical protein WC457_02555 [Patescibacteria group bacterium]
MKKIKLVDGYKIRNSWDINFAMIGDRISYPYIPQNEIWLEKTYLPEKKFLLNALQEKRAFMKKYGYPKYLKMIRGKTKFPCSAGEVKINQIKRQGNIKIYLVDGAKVRQNFDPFFTMGGHWLVYNYVPKNEVWIDNAPLTKEIKYVLIHELFEAKLMANGKNYDNAHDWAHAAEKEARRNDGAVYYED